MCLQGLLSGIHVTLSQQCFPDLDRHSGGYLVKHLIRNGIQRLAARNEVFIGGLAAKADVRAAISLLRPVAIQTPLVWIGGQGDGGYLLPDDLDGIDACFSPGVDDVATFETQLVRDYPILCFLADASVERAPSEHPLITFEQKFIGSSPEANFTGLEDWIAQRQVGTGDLLLQMDVEGAEYDIFTHLSETTLMQFRTIVIELHHLHNLFSRGSLALLTSFFRKLTMFHHVVHLHPNNCAPLVTRNGISVPPVLEVTLCRKDRCFLKAQKPSFSHSLDRPNVKEMPDIELSSCWR